MDGVIVLEKNLINVLKNNEMKMKDLELENLTRYLGIIVGLDGLKVFDNVVHVSKEEEYDTLMKVFEACGRWMCGLPSDANVWKHYECNTCIWDNKSLGGNLTYNSRKFYKEHNIGIITSDIFYEAQNISA